MLGYDAGEKRASGTDCTSEIEVTFQVTCKNTKEKAVGMIFTLLSVFMKLFHLYGLLSWRYYVPFLPHIFLYILLYLFFSILFSIIDIFLYILLDQFSMFHLVLVLKSPDACIDLINQFDSTISPLNQAKSAKDENNDEQGGNSIDHDNLTLLNLRNLDIKGYCPINRTIFIEFSRKYGACFSSYSIVAGT